MKGAGSEKKRHSNIWFWSYIMKRRLQAPQRIAVAPRVLLVQKVKCALGSQHSLPSRPASCTVSLAAWRKGPGKGIQEVGKATGGPLGR